jgi:hypothetical protein
MRLETKLKLVIIFFISFFLFSNFSFFVYSNSIYTSKTLDWDIKLIGNLDIAGHEDDYVEDLESILSLDNTIKGYQDIRLVTLNTDFPNSYEIREKSVKVNWDNVKPPKTISFSFDISAQTYFNFFSYLDSSNSNLLNSEYLSLSAPLNVNDNLRQLALSLKSDEDLKTLYNVLVYLDDNMVLNQDPQIFGSIDTYEKKAGNLISVINLAMSILRVNGLSCRYVSGLIVEENNLINTHSWIEVYVSGLGFIPVDILYKQVGYLDIGHLKLYDSYIFSDEIITHSGKENEVIDIDSDNLRLDAKITDFAGTREKKINVQTKLLHDLITHNSYNILSLNLENMNPFPVIIYLDLDNSQIFEIQDSNRYVFIPNQSTKLENFLFTQKVSNNDDNIEMELKETNPKLNAVRDIISVKYNLSSKGTFLSKNEAEELIKNNVNLINNNPTPEKIRSALEEDLTIDEIEIIIDKHDDIKDVVTIQKISVFDNETNKTTVYLNITPEDKVKLANFSIYESIPKCLAEEIGMENFNDDFVEIINTDPLIVWNFGNLDAGQLVSYEILTKLRDTDCEDESLTIAIADSIIKDLKTMSVFKVYLIVLVFVSFIFIFYFLLRPTD